MSDAEQLSDLTRLYGECGDDELVALGRKMDDLTVMAQQALMSELSRRRLSVTSTQAQLLAEYDEGLGEFGLPFQYAYRAPEHCVTKFAEREDALAAAEWLRAEGIVCDVQLPDTYFESGPPRVAVAPKDAERASAMLAGSIPEEFKILIQTRDQFEVPVCPKCKTADPLLEAIEPANEWLCEACGHTWVDVVQD